MAHIQDFALTFPGQGSQSIGMGKAIADAYPEARAVFEEIDDVLDEKLSSIIWDGPIEALTLTSNTQPALMAVSIAIIRALQARGFDIWQAKFVAGHSLGEYSALAASGAISLGDTARLLRIRGEAMQKAVPVGVGAMAAIIGLERDQLVELCKSCSTETESVQIANDNGGGQLVISGHKSAVECASNASKEAGAKRALTLPVSAPFHSVLMAPAAEAMREALANVDIKAPAVPLIANVRATPIDEPDQIRKCLVEQVTGQVRWCESVQYIASQGVTNLLEIGAGKVLTGLARRIDKSIAGRAIGTPDDINSLLDSID